VRLGAAVLKRAWDLNRARPTIFNILASSHAEKIDNVRGTIELKMRVGSDGFDRQECRHHETRQIRLAPIPTAVVYTADSRGLGEREFEAVKCPTEEAFALSK
jgi:hypothetical protein